MLARVLLLVVALIGGCAAQRKPSIAIVDEKVRAAEATAL